MSDRSNLKKGIDLFLIGFAVFYFEMLFIRLIPSLIQIAGYFPNIILLSCLLGVGIGCLLVELRFKLIYLFAPLVLNAVFLLKKLSAVPLHAQFVTTEYLPGFYITQGLSFLFIILIVFVLNTITFIPLGQKTAECLRYFKPLAAYSVNIAGSIAGIIIFSALSYLQLAPIYWFLVGLLPMLWFYISSVEYALLQSFVMAIIFYNILPMSVEAHWSPYYKIGLTPAVARTSHKTLGLYIVANNMNRQSAFNLSDASVTALPELRRYKEIYEFPYNFIKPENVLILGAGCGNDAAAALRKEVRDITAVEIDPYIASLGRTEHPERPYNSTAVRLRIDDARSFLKKTNEKFDLVIFGYIESDRMLSPFSSIRLDSFVYTEEAFANVRNILSKNGLLSVTCFVSRPWVGEKVYATMRKVFNDNLKVFRTTTFDRDDTAIFLAGPGVKNISVPNRPDFKLFYGFNNAKEVLADDMPYLYLKKKGIPFHYLAVLVAVLVISFVSIFYLAAGPSHRFDGHFFFLGAGFMLLETAGITRSSLLFGSTWVVNSAVIASILCMILLANLCASKIRNLNINIIYILLGGSLILNWVLKPDMYLGMQKTSGIILSSLMLSLPLLFAGILFSGAFRDAKDVPAAFAFNIFGAIFGGVCEYISMMSGFDFLFLLAAGIYYLSYIGRGQGIKLIADQKTVV